MPEQTAVTAEQEARLLVPEWTYDDFCDEAPYKWLYKFKDNQWTMNQMVAKVQKKAKEVKFPSFSRMWNSYIQSMRKENAIVVGENSTAFPEQKLVLNCRQYNCDELGISYIGQLGQTVEVLSHPLMPVKRVVNMDSGEQKLEIAYSRGGGAWESTIVGKGVLASAQKIIALADKGIAVNSENAKELVKYITAVESSNYNDLPQQKATSHLGWLPNGEFAPYCEDVVYDGETPEFKRMFEAFKETGSKDVWMKIAKDVRSGRSVPARIALAASFAAPLIKTMNALPFFVHIWGTQGCGKTVGLMLAASVWGNPTVGQYIKTFGGTKVSQEIYASFCGDVPIILDELQIISDRKTFDDIIYMLCEGVSKGRGSKDGGLQLQRHWQSVIITSAEMPIVQSNSGGGAAVRTIEVNYSGEPLFEDSRSVAETLKQNYGFAGKMFIEALKDEDTMKALREAQHKFYNLLSGDIQDKQVLSASILLAADRLADVTIFHDNKSLTVDDVLPYLITREQADINNRAYQWLTGYIAGNPRRFDSPDEQNGEQWGVIEDNIAYFNRTYFDRVMQSEGFSPGSFLTWASRNGKIIRDNYGAKSGNNRLTKRKKVGPRVVQCVALVLPSEDEDSPSVPEGFTHVEDDDMPF